MSLKPKYPVGTKFKKRGKKNKGAVYEVIDYLVTFNLEGEAVKRRYVASNAFCGQVVVDYDVPETTISMGVIED